ncbi:MAG: DUF3021 domain-containing protein [Erysipelotrichaceae bacterium]
MKKEIFKRALLGFPLGIAIGYVISIISSLIFANGYYSACVPMLIEKMGSEINAVILQTVLSGLLGSVFAGSSIIWELDEWSIIKQTVIYFMIISITMIPIAYITNWMEHSIEGFLIYFLVFVVIFSIIWLTQYLIWKANITKINSKL